MASLPGEKSPTILVADASSAAVAELSALFEREGYSVRSTRDGTRAVELACSDEVSLCVIGTSLPNVDGLAALGVIRASEAHSHLPVVFVAKPGDADGELAALRLGADDVIRPPFDDARLLARIRRCLQLKAQHDALAQKRIELEELSVTDGLTLVKNHRFFQDRVREEFRRAQRYEDPLALILLDLDHFKAVNDRYGHPVGDEVLKDVARSLNNSVRETDVVARYGGEEFAVLLPKTHLAGSLTVAERIWRDIGTLRAGPGGNLKVTASIGVSGYPGRGVASQEQLVGTADDALYRAKREGRNKICLFQPPPPGPGPAAVKAG